MQNLPATERPPRERWWREGAAPTRGLAALPGRDRLDELVHLLRDPTGYLLRRTDEYGPLWKTRFVMPAVFAVGEAANKTMLVTRRADFSQGQGYHRTPVRWVFEGSIMLQDGDQHVRTRETLSPAVGKLAIRDSAERVWALWDGCAARVGTGSHDVYELSERTTFEVAANVLIGLELGAETDAFRPLFEDVIGGMVVSIPLRLPFGKLHRSKKARAALIAQLRSHVLRARSLPPTGLVGQLAHARTESGGYLSPEEIVEHLILLAWAGYDTTASTSSWILHRLADRPDWQVRLRDELAAIDDVAVLDNGAKTPQLEAFLLEIERCYPSALFFPRVAEHDVDLLGHAIPAGTLLFYSPYLSHRDPDAFSNPHGFDPDRWLGPSRPSPAKLFGFGGGFRVCLGKSFAKLQLRLMVRAILRRHRIEPDPLARPKIQGLPVHHPVGSRVRFTPV